MLGLRAGQTTKQIPCMRKVLGEENGVVLEGEKGQMTESYVAIGLSILTANIIVWGRILYWIWKEDRVEAKWEKENGKRRD